MITYETAKQIAIAYEEIKAARELLGVLEKAKASREEPDLRDTFGRQQKIQMGVPSGQNSHRLFHVENELATYVIDAHIAQLGARLGALNSKAATEL